LWRRRRARQFSNAASDQPVDSDGGGRRRLSSVDTDEGSDPEPEAPPDEVGTLRLRGRVKLPQEATFVVASEDALWVTSPAGKLWRIDAGTGKVTDVVDLPDLGLARPVVADGSVWLAEMSSGRLLRLDLAEDRSRRPTSSSPRIGL